MNKVIYFNNDSKTLNLCCNETYFDFLDYAFSKADYFMLVYVNYYGKGYTKQQKYFRNKLKNFKVKSRSNPSWPGTLNTVCPNTTYKIIFYRTNPQAKNVLKELNSINAWSRPNAPEDLAFFKKNECWFYSVGHENIAAFLHADDEDLEFVETKKLAVKSKVFVPEDNYFELYNEELE